MFTICTECHRQFRITAEQLNAAEGQVMCGYCGAQFNALENLSDTPTQTLKSESVIQQEEDYKPATINQAERYDETIENDALVSIMQQMEEEYAEPGITESEISRSEKDKVISPSVAASILESSHEPPMQDITETPPADEVIRATDELDTRANFEQQLRSLSNDDAVEKKRIDQEFVESDLAFEYLQPDNEEPGLFSRVLWFIGSILLLCLICTQLLWFQRERLIVSAPQLLPYYKQVCEHLACSIFSQQDYSKLQLVSRDVRMHPQFSDSILVNAVMVNRSENTLAYPRLLLSLYDTNGRLVSYRKFQPEQYLDSTVEIANGMLSNTPLHFVLELNGTIGEAVSFEFDFY